MPEFEDFYLRSHTSPCERAVPVEEPMATMMMMMMMGLLVRLGNISKQYHDKRFHDTLFGDIVGMAM